MLFRLLLATCLILPVASAASQYSLDICNTGGDEFYLSTAEKPMYSVKSMNVAGWSVVKPGECWKRTANGAYHVDIHISFADPNGKSGTLNTESLAIVSQHPDVEISRAEYCIDLFDKFSRDEEASSSTPCPRGWVRARFPITVKGTPSNARIDVAIDASVAHAREDIFYDLVKEQPVAQSSDEPITNASLVADIRRLAVLSGRLGAPKTTKNGDQTITSLFALIGDMTIDTTYIRDVETKEIVRCDISHRYGEGEIHYYVDEGCEGNALKYIYKNGTWGPRKSVSDEAYARVLSKVKNAWEAVNNLDRDIAEPRLLIMPDFDNVHETAKIMQNMVYVFEEFPEFDPEPGFSVSEDSVDLKSYYSFRMAIEGISFTFSAERNTDKRYSECKLRQAKRHGKRIAWLDRECNGSFEYYSENDDGMYKRPKDEGSFIAKMMRDRMQQTLTFMKVYEDLLTLPR